MSASTSATETDDLLRQRNEELEAEVASLKKQQNSSVKKLQDENASLKQQLVEKDMELDKFKNTMMMMSTTTTTTSMMMEEEKETKEEDADNNVVDMITDAKVQEDLQDILEEETENTRFRQ